jgi:hypothetical protein
MGTDGILSRLRVKKSSDGQSKPPYPRGKFDHSGDAQMAMGDPPIFSGGLISSNPPTKFESILGLANVPDMWAHLNQEELMRQVSQAQVNHNAQQASVPMFPTPPPPPPPPPATLATRAREMFLKRMGGIRAELRIAEGDFLACHIYGEVVHVFYCFGGRPGVAQESIDLFPSDQFITQFRIILAC